MAKPATKIDLPLRARLVGDVVEISIGAGTVAFAAEHLDTFNEYRPSVGRTPAGFVRSLHVVDPRAFARDVVAELNREREDGATPLSDLLDRCCEEAVNQGSPAVEDPTERKGRKRRAATAEKGASRG